MGKKTFKVRFEGEAVIELDDAVIAAVDDEWRSYFYSLHSPLSIAEHIAYNLVINKRKLSDLDGWADQPDENASVLDDPDWDVFALPEWFASLE
jgi:hypothetical protein